MFHFRNNLWAGVLPERCKEFWPVSFSLSTGIEYGLFRALFAGSFSAKMQNGRILCRSIQQPAIGQKEAPSNQQLALFSQSKNQEQRQNHSPGRRERLPEPYAN